MKKLMTLVLSFGLVLLGMAPVMAADSVSAVKVFGSSQYEYDTLAVPEPLSSAALSDEALEEVDGEGGIGAILGGLGGMLAGALLYSADAVVGVATGHCTANAHDFVATVSKSAAASAAWGFILPEP